jgi:hypothetical protein
MRVLSVFVGPCKIAKLLKELVMLFNSLYQGKNSLPEWLVHSMRNTPRCWSDFVCDER